MRKAERYFFFALLVLIPVVIYIWFLKWRTGTFYGDDLYVFTQHQHSPGVMERINMLLSLQKYRPVQGLSMHIVMECFQKNVYAYYVFNVAMQTINTFIFAALLNLFLRSRLLSLFISLTLGVSRFALFNIIELLNGGPLEALAMTFFLATLFYLLSAVAKPGLIPSQRQKLLLLSLLFANLDIYTHERYIVIFPFIILMILFLPALRTLSRRQRTMLILLSLVSILLNFGIKKFVYSMPFFTGTGGTQISLSFSSVGRFLTSALLSIFQINSGDSYLAGVQFGELPIFEKIFVLALLALVVSVLVAYFIQIKKNYRSEKTTVRSHFPLFILLWILFGFLLVPGVSTIRLEQRWFQASSAVFILLIMLALAALPFKGIAFRNIAASVFAFLFLVTDFNYLRAGGDMVFMVYAEKDASAFRKAMDSGVIYPQAEELYFFEAAKNPNVENHYRWVTQNGDLFGFYGGKAKKMIYIDSTDAGNYFSDSSTARKFKDKKAEMISYVNYPEKIVTNISSDYSKYIGMDPNHMVFTVENVGMFDAKGFHANENGFRWTNGNASLTFQNNYLLQDSVVAELNTFMPSPCKNVVPKLVLEERNDGKLFPVATKRSGDKFIYYFYFKRPKDIRQIDIVSDTIDHRPDVRVLSFPFLSLEINVKRDKP